MDLKVTRRDTLRLVIRVASPIATFSRSRAMMSLAVIMACQHPRAVAPTPVASPVTANAVDAPMPARSSAACPCRTLESGIFFQLGLFTSRHFNYGTRAVTVLFGPDTAPVMIPPEYLWVTSHGTSGLPNDGVYAVPSAGILPITVQVNDTSGIPPRPRLVASVRVEISLRPEWLWYALITIRHKREPNEYVFSDPAVRFSATPLPGGDSLFVRISGRPRGGPAVFR